ncbi:MAG: flagellar hook capping FlgD N-terminal domain-containing protein [Clostridiaceae bacterium]
MNINGIGTNAAVQVQTEKKSMGIDDFLKIMTAQMKNLDPMGGSSEDSSQYLAQMAQFTMLEQLNNVKDSLEGISILTQQQISFSLVGKTVTVDDGLNSITGVVEKIRYREGNIYPVINGEEYPMGMVKEVGEE